MKEKYFLYIDILGFGDLVKNKPTEVEELFKIIDTLHVHKHNAFKTIVFSDTILVYNTADPLYPHDHEVIVMYACEFVKNLLYSLTDKDIYFRAILTYGNFVHYNMTNIECYFGDALVNSYSKEKEINGTGLFIDKKIKKFNKTFPTTPYDNDLDFVYLLSCFETLDFSTKGELPLNDMLSISKTDDYWAIKFELRLLKNIYNHSIESKDTKVRSKFLQTYQLYKNRYQKLLTSFEFEGFSPEVINSEYDWTEKLDNYN